MNGSVGPTAVGLFSVAPDPDVVGDVVETRRVEAALGEVTLGGGDDLGTGLEAAVAMAHGRGSGRSADHGGC